MLSFPLLKLLLEYSQDIFNFVIISHLLLMYNIHERITQFYKDAASVQVKIFVFCWDSQSPLHVYIFNFIFETCILCIYVIFTFIHFNFCFFALFGSTDGARRHLLPNSRIAVYIYSGTSNYNKSTSKIIEKTPF